MNNTIPTQKNISSARSQAERKEGFMLFYVMGTLSLMTLAAMISLNSSRLESRTARNHFDSTRALYHAEAGVKLVQRTVENRLADGERLGDILATLRVKPPDGVDFDEINTFTEIVPDRMFSFESVGRSNEAKSSVVVHFRRRPLIPAALYGANRLETKPNVKIYGYDSREITAPTQSNGGAAIGSNGPVDLGNHLIFDGTILLGESIDGMLSSCSNCEQFVQVEVGHQDPDPLGLLDGGQMQALFESTIDENNNQGALNAAGESMGAITSILLNGGEEITLTSGDYYFTSFHMQPHSKLNIDDTDGPVRIFMDGRFNIQPNTHVNVKSETPWGFQIYSRSAEDVNLQPNGNLIAYIYAPNSKIELKPGNKVLGAFWGKSTNVQPGTHGSIWLDTSLTEQMLTNNLETHAWYEQHGSF
ncbi:MAG: hypothetical protein LAT83_23555 [Kiritimatiellae bacterium]|nr:hypothetical protein [Kiritimatiellia bacterium]